MIKAHWILVVVLLGVSSSWFSSARAGFNEEFKKKTGINPAKPIPKISVHDINGEIKKKTGIDPAKPYPKISVNDINNEIRRKFGVDPKTPLEKAGDNWLFKGWKPFREPFLPAERAADEAMLVVKGGEKGAVLFLESMLWNRHWPDGLDRK